MKVLAQLALDVLGLGGLAVFVFGVYEVFPPAAHMLGGLILAGVASIAARKVSKL